VTEDAVYVAHVLDEIRRRNAFAGTFLEDLAEQLQVHADIRINDPKEGLLNVNSFHVTLDRSHRTFLRVIQRERGTTLDKHNPRIELDLGSLPKSGLSPAVAGLYGLGWNAPEKILANLSTIDAGRRKPVAAVGFLRQTLQIISEAIQKTLQSVQVQEAPLIIDIDIVCKAGLERSILLFNFLLFAFKTLREFEIEHDDDIVEAATRSVNPSPFIPDRPSQEDHAKRVQVKRPTWDTTMKQLGPRLVYLLSEQ
jgi:hypothetical protein